MLPITPPSLFRLHQRIINARKRINALQEQGIASNAPQIVLIEKELVGMLLEQGRLQKLDQALVQEQALEQEVNQTTPPRKLRM